MDTVTYSPLIARDLASVVLAQLPEKIRKQVRVVINADPCQFRVVAVILDERGGKWETLLGPLAVDGNEYPALLDGEFIAKLCAIL